MNNAVADYSGENYIFFSIGTFNYAFNVKYVLNIMQIVELEYPESMPDYIAGLLKYNNQIIKIIDIRNILKCNIAPYNLNSKIIIIKTEHDTFGIIVDDVKEIRKINKLSLNAPPYDREKSYLEAIYTDKEFSAIIINLEQIEKKINKNEDNISNFKNSSTALLPKDKISKETLHRRRLHYAKKTGEVSNELIKSQNTYITFRLDKNICCIKIFHIAGFYKFLSAKLTKVPCTPDFIVGIANIKGRYITVIDLLKFIENRSSEITKDTSIIVIEYEDYEIGIMADAIGETIDIAENLVNTKQETVQSYLNECVINNIIYSFFDVKKFFGDEKLYVS